MVTKHVDNVPRSSSNELNHLDIVPLFRPIRFFAASKPFACSPANRSFNWPQAFSHVPPEC
jgi:hypothetical protein